MVGQAADLPPNKKQFIFILIDSYSKSSGRPGDRSSGRSTHPGNGNFIFILIDYYSKSSGRPGDRSSGRSTPKEKAISDS